MQESLTRYNVYNYLYQNLDFYLTQQHKENSPDTLIINELFTVIKSIVTLLEGIENIDFRKDENSELNYVYIDTLEHLENNFIESEYLLSNIPNTMIESFKRIKPIFKKKEKIKLSTYFIKKIVFDYLKQVTKFAEEIFTYYEKIINTVTEELTTRLFQKKPVDTILNKKVKHTAFLSYAYDDKFYTLGIFLLFLDEDILLYVDWIFNDKTNNIIALKKMLNNIMSDCRYFIFLRTLNSELSMSGNSQIRQWCSWEIGTFYQYSNKFTYTKYYIETIHMVDNKGQLNNLLNDFSRLNTMNQLIR